MSLAIQLDTLRKISARLRNFSWVRPSRLAKFRCPYCLDSKKSESKTRGYIFVVEQALSFKCHNCGETRSFSRFLKDNFSDAYKEYRLESLRASRIDESIPTPQPVIEKSVQVLPFPMQSISRGSEFYDYLRSRKIPLKTYQRIYCVDNLQAAVSEYTDMYKDRVLPADKRIIFPLYDGDSFIGINCRAIDNDASMRYITLKFTETNHKIFGLDSVNTELPLIITEGPIDSLFLENAIAICGGDIPDLSSFSDITVVLDNEPRSKDTIRRMEKVIALGYKICIWGIDSKYKDINDMILKGGFTKEEIEYHIKENSFCGLKAKLRLNGWKKI